MDKDDKGEKSMNKKRARDNLSEASADQADQPEDSSSSATSAVGSGTAVGSAAASGSTSASRRKRKDGRLHVPKGSLTEEMLINERNRVLEKLKTKPKEEWTKEEVAEERRTASRLSEFQSRSRWKTVLGDLKKASEEQGRQSFIQQQEIAELQAELLSVQRENETLRRHLATQPSFGGTMRGFEEGRMVGLPSILQSITSPPPREGLNHLLWSLAAQSTLQQQLIEAQPPTTSQPEGLEHLLRSLTAQSTPQQQLIGPPPPIILQHEGGREQLSLPPQQLTGSQPPTALQQASFNQTTSETNTLVQLLQYMRGAAQRDHHQ
eukprot:scaffold13191_cov178-Amphora_coffeaeformis.AAC.2